jgi:putative PIN family toxin of toxin-antitoxin system
VKKIRVILDTNWYISATINKNSRRVLYELLTNKNLIILFSDEILKEYKQVIARDKFKKIIKTKQVTKFMSLVMSKLELIELKANLTGSRDLKDNFLLSLSFDSNADYLITGDTDLLVLQTIGSTQIVTLRDFLEIISPKT